MRIFASRLSLNGSLTHCISAGLPFLKFSGKGLMLSHLLRFFLTKQNVPHIFACKFSAKTCRNWRFYHLSILYLCLSVIVCKKPLLYHLLWQKQSAEREKSLYQLPSLHTSIAVLMHHLSLVFLWGNTAISMDWIMSAEHHAGPPEDIGIQCLGFRACAGVYHEALQNLFQIIFGFIWQFHLFGDEFRIFS